MTTLTPLAHTDLRSAPRICASGTVVCLATGPSLTPADVAYVQGKATVIAVNDAHRLAPWADVLYSSDRYWWLHYRGVPSFPGLKIGIEHTPGKICRELQRLVPDFLFLRQTGHDGIDSDPTALRTGRQSSGGAAINLAVHLGAQRILLLGYDCGQGASAQRHFFGDHPSPLSNTVSNYPSWRVSFDLMRPDLDALVVTVLNCSRSTSITAFPCVPLEEAL